MFETFILQMDIPLIPIVANNLFCCRIPTRLFFYASEAAYQQFE
jgi:hypothetical protein